MKKLVTELKADFETLWLKKNFSLLTLGVTMFFLPLSINLSSIFILVTAGLKILEILVFKNKNQLVEPLKISLFISIFLMLYLIANSLVQSSFRYTLEHFELYYSHYFLFILLPFILGRHKQNNIVFKMFMTGFIVAVVYVIFYAIGCQKKFGNEVFIDALDIHHTYLSLYSLTIINLLLSVQFNKKKAVSNKSLYINIVLILMLFGLTIILKSKISAVAFFFLILLHLFTKKPLHKKAVAITIFIVFIMLGFYTNLQELYARALNYRVYIWQQCINSITENIIFGNVKLSEKDILNLYHYKNFNYALMDSDLNSHNQYLSILLKYGVFGGLIFSLYTGYFLKRIKQTHNLKLVKESVGFLIILTLFLAIENVFDRHHGIVFVAFFYNFYLIKTSND